MTRLAAFGVCLVLLAGAACGGSSTSPSGSNSSGSNSSGSGGTPQNGSFKATVQGSSFTASSIAVSSTPAAGTTIFSVGAATASGTSAYVSISFAVTNPAVKTFNISNADLNFTLIKSNNVQTWTSSVLQAGSSGTLTFTSFTANRAIGTFSFVALPNSNATGNQSVTNGTFDITF